MKSHFQYWEALWLFLVFLYLGALDEKIWQYLNFFWDAILPEKIPLSVPFQNLPQPEIVTKEKHYKSAYNSLHQTKFLLKWSIYDNRAIFLTFLSTTTPRFSIVLITAFLALAYNILSLIEQLYPGMVKIKTRIYQKTFCLFSNI